MKIWNTKYALTQGILEQEARECRFGGMVDVYETLFPNSYLHGEGKEWHRTKEGAIQRAEELRTKRIESLKKQIAKLEALKFDV